MRVEFEVNDEFWDAINSLTVYKEKEIIHCKDCKYWTDAGRGYNPNTNSWSTVMVCDYNECSEGCGHTCWITDADDFCSRGERRDDNEDKH